MTLGHETRRDYYTLLPNQQGTVNHQACHSRNTSWPDQRCWRLPDALDSSLLLRSDVVHLVSSDDTKIDVWTRAKVVEHASWDRITHQQHGLTHLPVINHQRSTAWTTWSGPPGQQHGLTHLPVINHQRSIAWTTGSGPPSQYDGPLGQHYGPLGRHHGQLAQCDGPPGQDHGPWANGSTWWTTGSASWTNRSVWWTRTTGSDHSLHCAVNCRPVFSCQCLLSSMSTQSTLPAHTIDLLNDNQFCRF